MTTPRAIYYLSSSTGILASDLGQALFGQFPETEFFQETIPFIRTEADARRALAHIQNQSADQRPIVISTILDSALTEILAGAEIELINLFGDLLGRLEEVLQQSALRKPGFSRNNSSMITKRVDAIHFTIAHDDGTARNDYDQADLVLVGISRSGKTPIAVYLATQFGIKTANYPLIQEDLANCSLPPEILRNRDRVIGLTISADILHAFRQSRLPDSHYAALPTCRQELQLADTIFARYALRVVHSDCRSLEETAVQVMRQLHQTPRQQG